MSEINLSEYMGAYIDGARENLDTMDRFLLLLEQNPSNMQAIEEIFRAAHTLKGMSATMGFEKVAHLTHEMENILDKMRSRQIPVTSHVIDVIFETFDVLRILVNDTISQTDSEVNLDEVIAKIHSILSDQGEIGGRSQKISNIKSSINVNYPTDSNNLQTGIVSRFGENQSQQSTLSFINEFNLSEFEKSGLIEYINKGLNIYYLRVTLVPDCLLKGPRVFMVLRSLDSCGCEIIKSIPEVKDLENEKFDRSFKMILGSEQPPNLIKESIESISEIEEVIIAQIIVDEIKTSILSQTSSSQSQSLQVQSLGPQNQMQPQVSNATQPYVQSPNVPPVVQSYQQTFNHHQIQLQSQSTELYQSHSQPSASNTPLKYNANNTVHTSSDTSSATLHQQTLNLASQNQASPVIAQQTTHMQYQQQVQSNQLSYQNNQTNIFNYQQQRQQQKQVDIQQQSNIQPQYQPHMPSDSKISDSIDKVEFQKEQIVQFVSFKMAGETYALDIKQVESIINLSPITRVPKAPAYVEGVINLRGEIIPVINLRRRLNLELVPRQQGMQIIILSFDEKKVKVGFLVDHVSEVLRIPESAIEPPSHISDGVDVEFLNGVGKVQNKIVILLNAEKIVFG